MSLKDINVCIFVVMCGEMQYFTYFGRSSIALDEKQVEPNYIGHTKSLGIIKEIMGTSK